MAPVLTSHPLRYEPGMSGSSSLASCQAPLTSGLPHHSQFTAPSMASVLEQLNVINGILFIPLR